MTISIHAPARGATSLVCTQRISSRHFNPRTREGCDIAHVDEKLVAFDFNPRTREGCDPVWAIRTSSAHKFQSTHPRGVRRWPAVIFTSWKVFQSTHPRGVRLSVYIAAVDQRIFQSTHPRGVRPTCCSLSSAMLHISIHAPARGATYPHRAYIAGDQDFNPRTREGCDSS